MNTESELKYERKGLTDAVDGMLESKDRWELQAFKDEADRCISNIFTLVRRRLEP